MGNIAGSLLLLLLISIFICEKYAFASSDEAALRDVLFNGTDPMIRPVAEWKDPIYINLGYKPIYLQSLDMVNQIFSIYGWLFTSWKIEGVQWDPANYGGIDFIAISGSQIWMPDIGVINSMGGIYGSILSTSQTGRLSYDGTFTVTRTGLFTTTCGLDLRYFPFDTQICHVELDSWTLPSSILVLSKANTTIDMKQFRPHMEWEIPDSWVHEEDAKSAGLEFTTVSFVFRLQRKYLHSLLSQVIPIFIVVSLELLAFILPLEAGGKLGMGAGLLTGQILIQVRLDGKLPESSDPHQNPLLSIYVLLAMILLAVEIVCSVIVGFYYYRRSEVPTRSTGWRRFLIGPVARCLCVQTGRSAALKDDVEVTDHPGENAGKQDVDPKDLARVLDRIFFWVFFIITVILILIIVLESYHKGTDDGDSVPLTGYGYEYNSPQEQGIVKQ